MGEEMALALDGKRSTRLLVIPPFFEEANKFRHQILEIIIRLNERGIDSICPDFPGCNESLAPHSAQSLVGWRIAAMAAANHFSATHVLAIRSGCWIAPSSLPGWLYAPPKPGQVLRAMLRARILAEREAGQQESAETLLEKGRKKGLEIAGWELGSTLIDELEATEFSAGDLHSVVDHSEIGGKALWLRAENDFDTEQAEALAHLIATGISS
ncbi:alpha/beta hydrolase family protein [Erythrobacter mangrovi]|nr:hypothetical protein [Erythrobacter mangrovi]